MNMTSSILVVTLAAFLVLSAYAPGVEADKVEDAETYLLSLNGECKLYIRSIIQLYKTNGEDFSCTETNLRNLKTGAQFSCGGTEEYDRVNAILCGGTGDVSGTVGKVEQAEEYLATLGATKQTCKVPLNTMIGSYKSNEDAACKEAALDGVKKVAIASCGGTVEYDRVKAILCGGTGNVSGTVGKVEQAEEYLATLGATKQTCKVPLNTMIGSYKSNEDAPCEEAALDGVKKVAIASCGGTVEYDRVKAILCGGSAIIWLGTLTVIGCLLVHVLSKN